jgi:hypothetical protein
MRMDKNSTALIRNRIIWFALLMGQVAFLVVIVVLNRPKQQMVVALNNLVAVQFVLLVTEVPVCFFIRRMIFRRGEVDGAVRPEAYSTGNIIFWAGCEAVSFFGLVIVFISGVWWPAILGSGIAMGLHVLTFPVGRK